MTVGDLSFFFLGKANHFGVIFYVLLFYMSFKAKALVDATNENIYL